MNKSEAIKILEERVGYGQQDEYAKITFDASLKKVEEALDMAVAALREQEENEKNCPSK